MSFEDVKIFTEKNLLDLLVMGHPYHPSKPSFLFVKRGRLTMKEQINHIIMEDFSIILIDPSSVYEILEYSNDIQFLMLNYDRSFIQNLSLKFNKLNAYRTIGGEFKKVYHVEEQEFFAFWRNLDNLDYYINQDDDLAYKLEIIESHFTSILYQFASLIAKTRLISKDKMTRSQEIVFDFIRFVSDYYLQEKSVEFYASKLMLSTRHLSAVLKEVTGKTANQIINDYIFNEAKALLSSTLKPINEIANELQFSDQFAFSHFFKKHQKVSPTEYRNMF